MTARVAQDGPEVGSNTEAGQVSAGVSLDTGLVEDRHVPLVELLIILNHGVFLSNIFHQSRPLVVQNHKTCIKARPEKR